MNLLDYLIKAEILDIFLKECRKSDKCISYLKGHTDMTINTCLAWDDTEDGWDFWNRHYCKCGEFIYVNVLKGLMYNYKKPSIFKKGSK